MELKQYLYIVRKWLWLIILGMILGGVIAFTFSYLEEPIHRSTAKVLISQASRDQVSDYGYLSGQQLVSTYSELLLTSSVLNEASERIDYSISSGAIAVHQVGDTNILAVRAEDSSPDRAALIANTIIEVLVEQNEQLQAGRFTASEESLSSQIQVVQDQITALQSEIENETEENIQNQQANIENQISTLQNDIVAIQLEIFNLQQVEKTSPWVPTPTLSTEALSEINQLQLDLEQKQGMLNLYEGLYFNLISSDSLGATLITDNNSSVTQYQSTLALYQQIYANLLQDYEATRLSRLENTTTVVSVEPAVPNYNPIQPQPISSSLLGIVVGIIFAAGIVFFVEYLDDTVKSPEEINRVANIPTIGLIPNINTASMNGHTPTKVFSMINPRSPTAEAFRSLRTNIEFASVAQPLKSLVITSSGPQEGKSTVAANLAAILVQGGKKVFLIDADMRRPYIHQFFKFENRVGLSEYFRDEVKLKDTFHYVDETNRFITIPSGKLPPNPAELLNSEKMEKLIATLTAHSDYVILDSPPLAVTDPVVLASKADGVLFIVRPTVTKLHGVTTSLNQLDRAQSRIIGIVMNNITKQSTYDYQRYCPSSYYEAKEPEPEISVLF